MDVATIAAAVHTAGALLRADGADLHLVSADPRSFRIQVRVDLAGASCPECVVPPALLAEMLTDVITREVRSELEVIVDDPRQADTATAPHDREVDR